MYPCGARRCASSRASTRTNGITSTVVSNWLIATRAAVLIMTFISAAIAGMLASQTAEFDFGLWLLVTIGLVMAHATNNLLNDLTDYRKGVDKDNYFRTQYGAQPIEQGLWTEKQLLTYAAVTGPDRAGLRLALTFMRGPAVLALLGLGRSSCCSTPGR